MIVYPRNTVTYLRNNQAVSWPGFEPATASHKSNVLTITPPSHSRISSDSLLLGHRILLPSMDKIMSTAPCVRFPAACLPQVAWLLMLPTLTPSSLCTIKECQHYLTAPVVVRIPRHHAPVLWMNLQQTARNYMCKVMLVQVPVPVLDLSSPTSFWFHHRTFFGPDSVHV